MKLVVPHLGTPSWLDTRLTRMAESLGLSCDPLLLEERAHGHAERLGRAIHNEDICLVVNAQVLKDWTGGHLSPDLTSCMTSCIPYLLVHGLTPDAFSDSLIQALSGGRLQSVGPVTDSAQNYSVAADSRDVCAQFSGISFGPVNAVNDRVLSAGPSNGAVRKLISIAGGSFMAAVKRENAQMFFLAGANILDMDAQVGDAPLSEYFSRFVPYVMVLRHIFGEECWRPGGNYASFILDDPLLQPKYGHLDFESLLSLMKEYGFATTVAFIPHNYRRSSKRTVEMFRRNSDRLAICFHGNDHTAGEFVSADSSRLNTMLRIAEARMSFLADATGLSCPKVMVFPHDDFSVEALRVLKSRSFMAAVNGPPHPAGRRVNLTLRELAQPAVLRHGAFPLFPRTNAEYAKKQDIAFGLFFGRPAFIAGHHDVFKRPAALVEVVSMINSIAPGIRWCGLETAIINSGLRRKTPDGTYRVRAYSGAVRLTNDRDSPQRFTVEWNLSDECPSVEHILWDGVPDRSFAVEGSAVRLSGELGPHNSVTASPIYRNDFAGMEGLGFWWDAKALIRRRLSEVRDNYISKNRYALGLHGYLRHWLLAQSGPSARQ
jgi:hypothetical protein